MPNSIIAEGKTTAEAVENGLKQLKVSKDKVEIKVLENEEKRSFFSILTPRVVKVELTLKDGVQIETRENIKRDEVHATQEQYEEAKQNIINFLNDFSKNFEDIKYEIKQENEFLSVKINGEDSGKLIGYRGDTLNAMQSIISSIANKNINSKIKVTLDIAEYRKKRERVLEELADKVARSVIKTGKAITLEPMPAYERKIIHSRLQDSNRVKTFSKGEEPYRKVVVSKK